MSKSICMLAGNYNPKRIKYPCLVEEKLDGIRVIFTNGHAQSRNRKEKPALKQISKIFDEHFGRKKYLIDTEITGENFNEASSLVNSTTNLDYKAVQEKLTINLLDIIYKTTNNQAFFYRLSYRSSLFAWFSGTNLTFKWKLPESEIAYTYKDLNTFYKKMLSSGKEGIIIKDFDSKYIYKRSSAMMKRKPFKDATALIVGFECSEGMCPDCSLKISTGNILTCTTCNKTGKIIKPNQLGKFVCKYKGKELRVGGGIKQKDRELFWATRETLIGKKLDFKLQVKSGSNKILARHPTFLRIREDV